MKTIVTLFLFFFAFQIGMARKLVVTSTSDDIQNPVDGMLRYFIKNFESNDTITFDVDKVNLEGSLGITNSVIIDGSSRGMVTLDGQYRDCIITISAYSSDTEVSIKNINIINGTNKNSYTSTGGMYVSMSSGSVLVENCIFENNEVSGGDFVGGALYTNGGIFKNCVFINNKAIAYHNLQSGGVIAFGGTFINCVIANNTSGGVGGVWGMHDAKFYNCTLSGNFTTRANSVGGITSEGEIINCVSYNNFSNGVISNIDAYGYGEIALIKNCAFESGNPLVGSNNNIGLSSSPFKGGTGADSLSLAAESPCINAGTTSGIEVLNTDLLGNNRIFGGKIDIGAYEYNNPVTRVFNNNLSNQFIAYPNPSSGKIYFKKDVLNSQILSVEIYTISGTQLYSIKEENVLQGFKIDQSGIFQLRVFTNEGVFHEKVVIQ